MKHDDTILEAGSLNQLSIPKIQSISDPIPNALAIDQNLVMCVYAGEGVWSPAIDMGEDLFDFTSHTFTGAASSPNAGPTLGECASEYGDRPFIGNLDLFDCVDGVQIWSVPATGTYRITSRGGGNVRSAGGVVEVTTLLSRGDKLRMIVGRRASSTIGGCGASVVYSDERGLISIAAGAGGYSGANVSRHVAANLTSGSGQGGSGSAYTLPTGDAGLRGGGGAGFNSDGVIARVGGLGSAAVRIDPTYKNCGLPGRAISRTYSQNSNWTLSSMGGFGGGGGGSTVNVSQYERYAAPGGGGGYTGGAAQTGHGFNSVPNATGLPGTNFAAENLLSSIALPSMNSDGQIEVRRL